ncbi:Hpt domain-containing protein [Methylogaea oryzae]|nr:Hpt domain-containing protein [Methylogaea oryzae]
MWSSGEMQTDGPNSNVPQEIIDDFMVEFHEVHQQCEETLMELERQPDNPELMRSLFRFVHTVKGNLSYVQMYDFMPLLQSVEDVLDEIRNGRMSFDDALSDVILLALDATQRLVNARVENTPPPMSTARFDEICKTIRGIVDHRAGPARDSSTQRAIRLLDPDTGLCDTPTAPAETAQATLAGGVEGILAKYGVALDDDLAFFRGLIVPLEIRSIYWVGRTERLLALALA